MSFIGDEGIIVFILRGFRPQFGELNMMITELGKDRTQVGQLKLPQKQGGQLAPFCFLGRTQ